MRNRMRIAGIMAVVTLWVGVVDARGNAPAGWYTLQGTSSDMVKDNMTGLIWQRGTAPTAKTWADAKAYCQSLGLGGHTWRLPTRAELVTLRDVGAYNPAIDDIFNSGGFVTQGNYYWTIDPFVPNTGTYWIVNFSSGYAGNLYPHQEVYVRCVR